MRAITSILILSFFALTAVAPSFAEDVAAKALDLAAPTLVQEPLLAEYNTSAQTDTGRSDKEQDKELKKKTASVREGEKSAGFVPDSKPILLAQEELSEIKSLIAQGSPIATTVEQLTKLVEAYPDYVEARLLLGRQQISENLLDAALQNLAPLLQAVNPDWQPWFWVATAYLAKGDLDSAKQNLETAASKNSRVCALWVQLSVLSQELGEHSSALQYLLIAEQVDANYGLIHFNRAYSLEHLGQPDQARRAYQRFLISDIESTSNHLRVIAMQRIDTLSQGVEVATRGQH